jgi:hypothetical protein
VSDTRQTFDTRQTPTAADGHTLPFEFAECHTADTRQTYGLPSVKGLALGKLSSLPSVKRLTLGKTPFAECQTSALGKLFFF